MTPSDPCLLETPLEHRLDLKDGKWWISLLRLGYKETSPSCLPFLALAGSHGSQLPSCELLCGEVYVMRNWGRLHQQLVRNWSLQLVQQPMRNWIQLTLIWESLEAGPPSVSLSDETIAPSHTLILSCETCFTRGSTKLSCTKISDPQKLQDNKCLLC